jgi:hypothetical protein
MLTAYLLVGALDELWWRQAFLLGHQKGHGQATHHVPGAERGEVGVRVNRRVRKFKQEQTGAKGRQEETTMVLAFCLGRLDPRVLIASKGTCTKSVLGCPSLLGKLSCRPH